MFAYGGDAPGASRSGDAAKGGRPIRVGIVDFYRTAREGPRTMFREQPRIEIVGEAQDRQGAMQMVEERHPDAVLLDVRLKGTSGLDTCRAIHERFPDVGIVFLTVYEEEQYIFEALRAGARGYVLKRATDDDLVDVIAAVSSGEVFVDPALTGRIAPRSASRSSSGPEARFGLSSREGEVLALVTEGLSNQKIGVKLFISEETVKSHVRSILRKLGVQDRTQAVSLALREGLIK
jgi:DNA-binding NarL/FixJ family response regulator